MTAQACSGNSKPSRGAAAPPPSSRDDHCLSCGRLMPLETRPNPTPRKYCSPSCKGHSKDIRVQPLRLELARSFHRILNSHSNGHAVLCSQAQEAVEQESTLGIRPAEQREEARRAARRLVNFGWASQGVEKEDRRVEAVINGQRVEGSFAKGEWGIRWADT